jgi:hypothetical protein
VTHSDKKLNTDFTQISLPLVHKADLEDPCFWWGIYEETEVFKEMFLGENEEKLSIEQILQSKK